LYAVRALHGVCEASLFASLFAYAADVVPAERRIEGIALFGVSGMLPMSVSSLLGDAILEHATYPTLFTVAIGFSAIGFVLLPALGALAIGFVLLSTTTEAGIAIAAVLCGLGHGFTFPILLGMVVSRARPSERGAALALYTALFDAGTLIGGPLLGLLITHAG